jgi:hypothetical protein
MTISAMKQALEALEKHGTFYLRHEYDYKKAITALRQAIAGAEKQEPVAYIRKDQLQKASQSPLLCEVTPEHRQDRIGIYTAPVHASDISQKPVDKTAKDRHEFEEMVKKGTKAWADTPDDWVDDVRGGVEKQEFECPRCGHCCQQREWVGLTDEEAKKTFEEHNCVISADLAGILARAIEAKLKEKNT